MEIADAEAGSFGLITAVPSRRCSLFENEIQYTRLSGALEAIGNAQRSCLETLVTVAAVDPNTPRIVLGSIAWPEGPRLRVRDLSTQEEVGLESAEELTSGLRFVAPNLLIGHGNLGPAFVWNASSGALVARLGVQGSTVGGNAECAHLVDIADDSTTLAISCASRFVLRDARTGKVHFDVDFKRELADLARVTALRFQAASPDVLVGLEDGSLALVSEGKVKTRRGSEGGAVMAIARDHKRQRATTVHADGGTRVWQLEPLAVLATFVEFADDEQIAFTEAGAYRGSAEVADRVGWTFQRPFEYFSFEQFASSYHSVTAVIERLRGRRDMARVASRPPHARILSSVLAGTKARLRVSVASPSRVDRVRVYAEGLLLAEQTVCAESAELDLEVPLMPGLNRLAVVAFDDRGMSSNPAMEDVRLPVAPLSRRELWAVAIGVSDYPKLAPDKRLPAAENDAREMAAVLRTLAGPGGIYGKAHVTELINAHATAGAVEQALSKLEAMKPEDVAIVLFAGHGAKPTETSDMVFLTGEVAGDARGEPTSASLRRDGVSWALIARQLGKARGRVLVLLDACQSGHISQELLVPNQALAQALSKEGRAGTVIFAAAKGGQASVEPLGTRGLGIAPTIAPHRPFRNNGLFTGAILNSLESSETDRDGDGEIQLSELIDDVTRQVTLTSGGTQTPWVPRKEVFGDFGIARARRQPGAPRVIHR